MPLERWAVIEVWMAEDGTVRKVVRKHTCVEASGFICWDYTSPDYNTKVLSWRVRTGDETRAIKVVNEKRAQLLALDLWGRGIRPYEDREPV